LCSVDDDTFFCILDGHNFGIDINPTIDVDDDTILPGTLDNEFNSDVGGVVTKKKKVPEGQFHH
jgi:hypothetical protein